MGLDQRTIIAVFLVSIRKAVDYGVSFCVMELLLYMFGHHWWLGHGSLSIRFVGLIGGWVIFFW